MSGSAIVAGEYWVEDFEGELQYFNLGQVRGEEGEWVMIEDADADWYAGPGVHAFEPATGWTRNLDYRRAGSVVLCPAAGRTCGQSAQRGRPMAPSASTTIRRTFENIRAETRKMDATAFQSSPSIYTAFRRSG